VSASPQALAATALVGMAFALRQDTRVDQSWHRRLTRAALASWALIAATAAASAGAVIDPDQLAPLWQRVDKPQPRPALQLDRRDRGCAVIAFIIDAAGQPGELTLLRGVAHPRLAAAAQIVVAHYRYAPGAENPAVVAVQTFEILTFGHGTRPTGSRLATRPDADAFAPCDLSASEVARELAQAAPAALESNR